MRKIGIGVVLTLMVFVIIKYCKNDKNERVIINENSELIQQQLKNVGKLIVTEGHFSEVFTYNNSKEIFGEILTFNKKALVVVNANVSISFDLSTIEYDIDKTNKTLIILNIPEEEITISPDLEYYDVQADFFNPFDAEDYNIIKESVKKSLLKKINKSAFKENAKNRLLSELAKFYLLTNSLGWTLKYNQTPIETGHEFQKILN